ncbi:MAG: MerR family transcriptional regulator, partial [Anaerolineae bacterium]|nr:MerR family transcriptional regulator [Anaerolineae bacterium]
MYTVKQLSELADVSIRTLHYYDEIGLLKPAEVGANGYRYYDDAALLRLQQILFYREIGLELLRIKEILDSPDFDLLAALRSHRKVLASKIGRLQKLVSTVDSTIMHLAGEVEMSKKRLFEGFSDEQQKDYERQARLQYGPDTVNDSIKRWNNYTQTQRDIIAGEGNQIYGDIVDAIEAGLSPTSAEAQAILTRWHEHLRYFYEPTLDILRGLGHGYNSHP